MRWGGDRNISFFHSFMTNLTIENVNYPFFVCVHKNQMSLMNVMENRQLVGVYPLDEDVKFIIFITLMTPIR